MNLKPSFLVAALLAVAACGPGFTGTVSGYSVNVQDELYVPLTDNSGATVGALLMVSDQTQMCSQLAATTAPANATMVMLLIGREANGRPLSPDVGKYTVSASGANASTASGGFLRTDANGTQSIPGTNADITSGLVDVTAYSNTKGMSGTFDGRFGQQADPVQFQFNAHLCDISTPSLSAGFVGRAMGTGSTDVPQSQSQACADYVACSYRSGISSYGSLDSTYGAGGTCWASATIAGSCTSACISANGSFKSNGYTSTYGCVFAQ
jgi:hypothetical protein